MAAAGVTPPRPPALLHAIIIMDDKTKNGIKKCFDSYKGWGENGPMFFTLRVLAASTEYKDLTLGEVIPYLDDLEMEWQMEWPLFREKHRVTHSK